MPLGEVMSYALHYAEHGYPVLPQIAGAIAAAERQFRDHWPSSAEIYLTGDGPPAAGSSRRNPPRNAGVRHWPVARRRSSLTQDG